MDSLSKYDNLIDFYSHNFDICYNEKIFTSILQDLEDLFERNFRFKSKEIFIELDKTKSDYLDTLVKKTIEKILIDYLIKQPGTKISRSVKDFFKEDYLIEDFIKNFLHNMDLNEFKKEFSEIIDETFNSKIIIGNTETFKFHSPSCLYVPMKENKRLEFKTIQEAKDAGYTACNICCTNQSNIIGNNKNNSYHLANCKFAPRDKTKRIEFNSIEEAKIKGYKPCSTCNPGK